MKLGGVNVIPDRRDVPWLTDPANPTIIMGTPLTVYRTTTATHLLSSGGDMSHPPPGSRRGPGGYPSYTSLVGSINSTGTKYVSTMGVQDSLHELIEDLENMCIVRVLPRIDRGVMLIKLNASTYSNSLEKRWASCPSAFYSIAVSNHGFFCPISCPNMTNVFQDGVSEAEFGTVIQDELKFIRSSSPAVPSRSRSY